jgi:hypothetical protein
MAEPTLPSNQRGSRSAPLQLNPRLATGCVVLFLVPFAAAGTFCAVQAVRLAYAGVWPDAVFLGIGALTFGGVGFGGFVGMRVAYRRMKEAEALQVSHPEQPWLWRGDWASGRIEDATRETLLGAWIFATFWNLVSLPGGYVGVRAALYEGKPAGLVALLFPVVGIWLLARAVHATIRKNKYGISRLELSTVPGVIGRTLAGTIHAPVGLQPAEGFQVSLSCVRRVATRSGKSSSTSESILWQEERLIGGEQSRDYAGMKTIIPITFQLPPDVEASDTTNPNNRVIWQLQVSANVPGVDYGSTFEVPIFRTSASGQLPLSHDASSSSVSSAPAAYRQPADSPIAVTTNRRGTEILFPAARNPGPAVGMTVFMVIWWAALGLQLYLRAPIVFPIVTGVFGILIAVFALDLWLKVSRVIVDSGTLTVATGYLEPGRERKLTAAEVADVVAAIGIQAGKTVYYDVVIRRKDGKKTTAGHSVRDKREAEWLAATIKEALGI